jgi:hypothetical protein
MISGMKHHVRRVLLLTFGVLFIAFGVGAFFGVPGGHDASHHTVGHNLTHIIAGLLVLDVALAGSSATRRSFCFIFGALYLTIGIIGVFSVRDSLRVIPGLVEFHLEDDWVQIGTGLLFVTIGLFKKVPESRDHALLERFNFTNQNEGGVMKKTMLLFAVTALAIAGCARDRHYVRYNDRHYVSEEHPADTVVIDRNGNRTYVREYQSTYPRHERENNMEPYARGKGPEAMGWNTENYYLQRGYR